MASVALLCIADTGFFLLNWFALVERHSLERQTALDVFLEQFDIPGVIMPSRVKRLE